MTLSELGAQFREARVHRGLLVDDVAKSLKISSKVIRALEDGNREDLPELVFLRGFIRSYGVFLGFPQTDLQATIELLEASETPAPSNRFHKDERYPLHEPRSNKSFFTTFVTTIVVVALLLGLGYGAFTYFVNPNTSGIDEITSSLFDKETNENNNTSADVQIQPPVVDPLENEKAVELPTSEVQTSEHTQTESPENIADSSEIENTLLGKIDNNYDEVVVSEAEFTEEMAAALESEEILIAQLELSDTILETTEKKTEENLKEVENKVKEELAMLNPLGKGSNTLILKGVDDCWISINLDNAAVKRNFIVKKGEGIELKYSNNAVIRYGNAGGIEVTLNGEEKGTPGALGIVVTEKYTS